MTKKHFKALAEAMKAREPIDPQSVEWLQWQGDCEALAVVMKAFNTAFDHTRFICACREAR